MPNLIVTNNERAAIGEKAVLAVFRDDIESGGIDLGTGIYDLVADLLHLARENDIEPDYIIHMAQMHFWAEVEEEAGINEDLAHEDTDNVFIVGPPANGKETQL
jgi:hypothetical protein